MLIQSILDKVLETSAKNDMAHDKRMREQAIKDAENKFINKIGYLVTGSQIWKQLGEYTPLLDALNSAEQSYLVSDDYVVTACLTIEGLTFRYCTNETACRLEKEGELSAYLLTSFDLAQLIAQFEPEPPRAPSVPAVPDPEKFWDDNEPYQVVYLKQINWLYAKKYGFDVLSQDGGQFLIYIYPSQ